MRRFGVVVLVVAFIPAGACGYFVSGTWADDPKNFARAWGYSKPDEIGMVHSWYWRSPHFTREESFFFQFRWHEKMFRQVVAANQMQALDPSSKGPDSEPHFCFPKPAWFVPKAREAYDAWRCTGSVDCWLFRERQTNDLFIYACQM